MTGIPEFAISVALAEGGNPVMGIVHNPATGELFTAIRGQGFRVNGEINRTKRRMGDKPLLLASRTEIAKG